MVLNEISSSSAPELQGVRTLADYFQNPGKKYFLN